MNIWKKNLINLQGIWANKVVYSNKFNKCCGWKKIHLVSSGDHLMNSLEFRANENIKINVSGIINDSELLNYSRDVLWHFLFY